MSRERATAEPPSASSAARAEGIPAGRRGAPGKALRVGHKGAAALAPGNTLAAFDAALAAGVDMIELDVLSERIDGSGELFVAHDYGELAARGPLRLAEALAHLAGRDFAAVELDVDIKIPGYGSRVGSALAELGLAERSLISCTYPEELDAIRAAHPQLRLGWSVPRVRRDYTASAWTLAPALLALQVARRILPARAGSALASGRFDAIMAHWRLVSGSLMAAVRDAGGELYVWTVDDAKRIAQFEQLGVHGIISNDPRLFEGALADDAG